MTLWVDAFGRGFDVGDELGQRMAERGIRRRTRELYDQYESGAIDEATLEVGVRDATRQGVAARRDMGEYTQNQLGSALRRRAARLYAEGNNEATTNPLTSLAGVTGNVELGMATSRQRDSIGALRAATDEDTGVVTPHLYQQNLARNRTRTGDATDALAANSEFETLNAKYQTTLANDIQRMISAGAPPSQTVGLVSELLTSNPRLAALDPQVYTSAGADGKESLYVQFAGQEDGFLINNEDIPGLLKSITDPNIVESIMGQQKEAAEAANAAEAKNAEDYRAAVNAIVLEVVKSGDIDRASASGLTSSMTDLLQSGVKVVNDGADGTPLMVQTPRGLFQQVPAGPDEEGAGGYGSQWIDLATNSTVDGTVVFGGNQNNMESLARLQAAQANSQNRLRLGALFEKADWALGNTAALYGFEAPRRGGRPESALPTNTNYRDFRRTLETGGETDPANARAGTSSATGIDQFIDRTWLRLIDQMKPGWAQGKTDQELLAMRTIPEVSAAVANFQDQIHGGVLQRAGLPTDPINMYAMHKLGQERGLQFAQAPDETPLSRLYSPEGLVANRLDPNMTKGELVQSWIERGRLDPAALTSSVVAPASATQPTAALPRNRQDGQTPDVASANPATALANADNRKAAQQRMARIDEIEEMLAELERVAPRMAPGRMGAVLGVGPSQLSSQDYAQAQEARQLLVRELRNLRDEEDRDAQRIAQTQRDEARQQTSQTIGAILARARNTGNIGG